MSEVATIVAAETAEKPDAGEVKAPERTAAVTVAGVAVAASAVAEAAAESFVDGFSEVSAGADGASAGCRGCCDVSAEKAAGAAGGGAASRRPGARAEAKAASSGRRRAGADGEVESGRGMVRAQGANSPSSGEAAAAAAGATAAVEVETTSTAAGGGLTVSECSVDVEDAGGMSAGDESSAGADGGGGEDGTARGDGVRTAAEEEERARGTEGKGAWAREASAHNKEGGVCSLRVDTLCLFWFTPRIYPSTKFDLNASIPPSSPPTIPNKPEECTSSSFSGVVASSAVVACGTASALLSLSVLADSDCPRPAGDGRHRRAARAWACAGGCGAAVVSAPLIECRRMLARVRGMKSLGPGIGNASKSVRWLLGAVSPGRSAVGAEAEGARGLSSRGGAAPQLKASEDGSRRADDGEARSRLASWAERKRARDNTPLARSSGCK